MSSRVCAKQKGLYVKFIYSLLIAMRSYSEPGLHKSMSFNLNRTKYWKNIQGNEEM